MNSLQGARKAQRNTRTTACMASGREHAQVGAVACPTATPVAAIFGWLTILRAIFPVDNAYVFILW